MSARRKRNLNKAAAGLAAFLCAASALAFSCAGCGGKAKAPLVMAATRDLEGCGILQAWAEGFRRSRGREVELVAVPDADALQMARHGECDLLLLHCPQEEMALESEGYVEGRREVMRDEYLLVGPPEDPAGVREAVGMVEAFKRIADSRCTFIMRTDGSGTAMRAESVWQTAGVRDFGGWFQVMDRDMMTVLQQASLKGAYTLCDASTFRGMSGELNLEELLGGGEEFANPYHVMVVSGTVFPDTDAAGAGEFVDYILSEEGRRELGRGEWSAP